MTDEQKIETLIQSMLKGNVLLKLPVYVTDDDLDVDSDFVLVSAEMRQEAMPPSRPTTNPKFWQTTVEVTLVFTTRSVALYDAAMEQVDAVMDAPTASASMIALTQTLFPGKVDIDRATDGTYNNSGALIRNESRKYMAVWSGS